jgi:hypothetical protein
MEDIMKIIAILTGVSAPVSVFAATGLMENNTDVCVFMFFGYCALLVIAQFVPAVLFFICMVKVIVIIVSESFVVQKN